MKEVNIVYASPLQSNSEIEEKYGKYCITKSVGLENANLHGIFNNKTALSKVYNTFIKNEDVITVLLHDDVLIRDENWLQKIKDGLKKYDIIGLAGGSNAKVVEPCLWHIMCPTDTLRGCVSHVNVDGNGTFVTNFGIQGRVLMLDGLFLAFNTKKVFSSGAKFDESNPAKFHFYDIDFSLTANSKKLKLGTVHIDVVHNSHGLKKYTEEWLAGQAWFKQKFNDGKYNF